MAFLSPYGIEVPDPGGDFNTWGTIFNDTTFPLFLKLISGVEAISLTGNKTLSSTNGVDNEARNFVLRFSDGGLSAIPTVTIPAVEKVYFVQNLGATYAITMSCGTGSVNIPASRTALVICDGTNVIGWDPVTLAGVLNQADKIAAQNAADDAEDARDDAQLAKTGAETAETNAETAVGYAAEWASKAENVPVSIAAGGNGSTTFSALHWAAKAAASAAVAALFDPSSYFTKSQINTKFVDLALYGDVALL